MFRIIFLIIAWIWNLIVEHWLTIVKVLGGIMVIGVIGSIVEWVLDKRRAGKETKILEKYDSAKSSNTTSALEHLINAYQTEGLSDDKYEEELLDLANTYNMAQAMTELGEYYGKCAENAKMQAKKTADKATENEKLKDAADYETKALDWKKKAEQTAARAGSIKDIIKFYGFADFTVSSKAYDEILQSLDQAKPDSDEEKNTVKFLRGVVCYDKGDLETAKEIFSSAMGPSFVVKNKYMLMKCFIQESHVSEAEQLLHELEELHWETDAAVYQDLSLCYLNGKGVSPDFDKALDYITKYEKSGARDTATLQMLKETFYSNMGVSFYKGINGLEKDIKKAYTFLKKVEEREYPEALACLGTMMLAGETDGVLINRNYDKANYYLNKAMLSGSLQAKEYLKKYGVDGIVVLPSNPKAVSYQFLYGYELTASSETMRWIQLYCGFRYKVALIATAFSDSYTETFKSFDQLVNGIHQLYADHVAQMLKWSMRLLMSFGIDMYRADDIMGQCEDLSLLPRVPRFEQGLDKIDNRAEQLNIQTAYAKATRGKWSGVGFGTTIGGAINATVKASVAAGMMNIGSGILHGIGDSIVEAMNNSEIKGMGKRLFENPGTGKEFQNAVVTACMEIADVVMEIIEKHSDIQLEDLKGRILFGGESLAEIDDRALVAKISNNLTAQNWEYTYALLLEKLRRQPLDANVFQQMASLTIRLNPSFTGEAYETILRYAGDFKLDTRNFEAALGVISYIG